MSNICEQMGNFSRKIETFFFKPNEKMLELKNMISRIKDSFSRLISRLYTTEENISDLEDLTNRNYPNSNTKRKKRIK